MSEQPAQPILRLTDLQFRWPDGPVLLDIPQFDLMPGERLFLHGPSGSGKSTLLGLIAGIHQPQTGSVWLQGQNLTTLRASVRDRVRGSEIGYVFQQFNLVPYLSVLENVLLPLTFSAERRAGIQGEPARQALDLLGHLGIDGESSARSPGALSVGQQQRVAVARALLGSPPLIICDEPTSALDADARDAFLDLLIRSVQDSRSALLFVSHDTALATHFTRQLALQGGRLVSA